MKQPRDSCNRETSRTLSPGKNVIAVLMSGLYSGRAEFGVSSGSSAVYSQIVKWGSFYTRALRAPVRHSKGICS